MSETNKTRPTECRKLSDVGEWHKELDVAVIGSGGAGICAAIEAKEAGADVTIFEVASGYGGSTMMSSAEIYMGGSGGTRVQKACGYNDSTENMIKFMTACAGEQADHEKIRIYCENSVAHFDWLVSKGIPFKDSELKERAVMAITDDGLLYTGNEKVWPFNKIADPVPRGHNLYIEGDNGGPLFINTLIKEVERLNIPIEYESRGLTLIQDENGTIHGIVIRQDQKELNVKTRKGVILCAGGFVMNQEMLKKHAPLLSRCNSPTGNPGDDGSGIRMGMGAGGVTINMHEGLTTIPFYPPATLTFGMFINSAGQRFINEDSYHSRVGFNCLQQQGDRIYLVFSTDDYKGYEEYNYLGADIAGTGETMAELEQELELPTESLQQTLEYYNKHAANGEDPKFHKAAEWLKPLTGPFAAMDCTPGRGAMYAMFTLGGLDTLPTGEVLTADGAVIKGLYAAGRTTAGVPRRGDGYASGTSVGDVSFFGRMAGKQAASA